MKIDFTTCIEDAIADIEEVADMERHDCTADGEAGEISVTLCDGRKFRVYYLRA